MYNLEQFTAKAIEIIKRIPEGKVMTYGQIATKAGSPRAARQVVRILHSMSEKHQLPWHRVMNAKGEIGIQDEELFINQKMLLENEGIKFDGEGSINIELYRYNP
jgi:methylated-DNA-protein-cysteine methyltransferase related protein